MKQAIEIYFKMDQTKIARDELLLIEIKYLMALGNIYYIKQDFREALSNSEKAYELASDDTKFSYETIGEAQKLKKDLESMRLKC